VCVCVCVCVCVESYSPSLIFFWPLLLLLEAGGGTRVAALT